MNWIQEKCIYLICIFDVEYVMITFLSTVWKNKAVKVPKKKVLKRKRPKKKKERKKEKKLYCSLTLYTANSSEYVSWNFCNVFIFADQDPPTTVRTCSEWEIKKCIISKTTNSTCMKLILWSLWNICMQKYWLKEKHLLIR